MRASSGVHLRPALAKATIALLVTSCAHYEPLPLPPNADLVAAASALRVPPEDMPLPVFGSHTFNPSQPFDMDEIGMLAVANNPDLRAARRKAGVAHAQAFAAGILPNPQMPFNYGVLTGGPGVIDAISSGLSQDIIPLLTRSARVRSAKASEQSVRLDLLWQEWQVVSQSRLLFVAAVELQRVRSILEETRTLLAGRYQRSAAAMRRGDETLPTVVSDLTALKAVETQINDTDQLILKNRHDLNALLGLKPDAGLPLTDSLDVSPIDIQKLTGALDNLAQRRPDLLALKAGYEAQEEKLREAVLRQFPALNIGVIKARDTTEVYTTTLGITISLPIFDRNQGNIAIEKATRQRLRDEYQARLDAAYSAAERLVSEQQLLEAQYQSVNESVTQIRRAVTVADTAYSTGNLDERSWVDLHSSLLAKRLEAQRLERTVLEQRINLQTLIGTNLPVRSSQKPGGE
ncbi:MAG: TolC family protein [Proteobacteria bacterium]|nr:TolC family protein [Pseudomonadota bacterium]